MAGRAKAGRGFAGRTPVVAVVGLKDVGKTRVVEGLVAYLRKRGFSVGTVKHIHGRVALEPATVDSGRHLAAGAACAVTVSDTMVQTTRRAARGAKGKSGKSPQATIDGVIARHLAGCDCVIVEGFKASDLPKVVVSGDGVVPPGLTDVVACVCRGAGPRGLPVFRPGEVKKLGSFLLKSGILTPAGAGPSADLVVDGRPVPMNEFVAQALTGVIAGFVGTLRDVESPLEIEVTIRRGRQGGR